MKFMAVRFGNVLGSSGSVIPKFKEQIDKGGPVTVTVKVTVTVPLPDIIRRPMTATGVARLVLQAAAFDESGQVPVLDIGEPSKIGAATRWRLAGHTSAETAIEFTGLRSAEKLLEECLADGDVLLPTAVDRPSETWLQPQTDGLEVLHWVQKMSPETGATHGARQYLRALIPEFRDTAWAP